MRPMHILSVTALAILAGCGGGAGGSSPAAPVATLTQDDVVGSMLFVVSSSEVGPRADCGDGTSYDSETMVRPYPEPNGSLAETTSLAGGVLTITETYRDEDADGSDDQYRFDFTATGASVSVLTGTFRKTVSPGVSITVPALAYVVAGADTGRRTPHPAWPVIWEDGDGYRYAMAEPAPMRAFGAVTSTRPGFVSGEWLQNLGCMYVHVVVNDGSVKDYKFGGPLTDGTALQAGGISAFGPPGSPVINLTATMHVVPGTTL